MAVVLCNIPASSVFQCSLHVLGCSLDLLFRVSKDVRNLRRMLGQDRYNFFVNFIYCIGANGVVVITNYRR